MARKKEYKEEEVIEKAMNLFWCNGFEATSMQMLEKEMEINKFSIYASFGNKNELFLESLKLYKLKLNQLLNVLRVSSDGADGIRQYFYDFINFSKTTTLGKGCLITNTANELGKDADIRIQKELSSFMFNLKLLFRDKLEQIANNTMNIEKQADYLIIALFGLSSASRVFDEEQLNNYIENIFINL